jgi:hypothetical protein
MTTTPEPITVAFIAGAGRSGSTLLARLLGELPGCVNLGEATAYVTGELAKAERIPCGCGESLGSCPFWSGILARIDSPAGAGGGALMRMRSIPLLAAPVKPNSVEQRLDLLSQTAGALIAAAAERTGSRFVIDSSKNPAVAHLLSRAPGLRLKLIHLVRDPRGFVSSRSRPKAYLERIPLLKATGIWLARNISTELVRSRAVDYARVRYEDLARQPVSVLKRLARLIIGHDVPLDFIAGNTATVGVQHIVGGNPDKLEEGAITIGDRGWELTGGQRLAVTGLTFPLLFRYGYTARRSEA